MRNANTAGGFGTESFSLGASDAPMLRKHFINVLTMMLIFASLPVPGWAAVLENQVILTNVGTWFGQTRMPGIDAQIGIGSSGENTVFQVADEPGPYRSFAFGISGGAAPDDVSLPRGLATVFPNAVTPYAAAESRASGVLSQTIEGFPYPLPVFSKAEARTYYSFSIDGPDSPPLLVLADVFTFLGLTGPGSNQGWVGANATVTVWDPDGNNIMSYAVGCQFDSCSGAYNATLSGNFKPNMSYQVVLYASALATNFRDDGLLILDDTSTVAYADPYFHLAPSVANADAYTFHFSQGVSNVSSDVPEPLSLALVSVGLLVTGAVRRRNKKWKE